MHCSLQLDRRATHSRLLTVQRKLEIFEANVLVPSKVLSFLRTGRFLFIVRAIDLYMIKNRFQIVRKYNEINGREIRERAMSWRAIVLKPISAWSGAN